MTCSNCDNKYTFCALAAAAGFSGWFRQYLCKCGYVNIKETSETKPAPVTKEADCPMRISHRYGGTVTKGGDGGPCYLKEGHEGSCDFEP